jgi:predicted membrane protein (TIGR00267 family)
MMAEEHQLIPVDRKQALRSALIVGIAALIGSLIPLVPFFFLPVNTSMVVSVVVAALVLFVVGAYKARAVSRWRSSARSARWLVMGWD